MTDYLEKKSLAELTARLADERGAKSREENNNFKREQTHLSNQAKLEQTRLALDGKLDTLRILHDLEPEKLEREFRDLVRRENLDVQSYLIKKKSEDNSRERHHQQDVNKEADLMIIRVLERLICRKLGLDEQALDPSELAEIMRSLEPTAGINDD